MQLSLAKCFFLTLAWLCSFQAIAESPTQSGEFPFATPVAGYELSSGFDGYSNFRIKSLIKGKPNISILRFDNKKQFLDARRQELESHGAKDKFSRKKTKSGKWVTVYSYYRDFIEEGIATGYLVFVMRNGTYWELNVNQHNSEDYERALKLLMEVL